MPELATALGVTVSALSRIETGKVQTTVHLRKIARRLELPGSLLLEDAERFLARARSVPLSSSDVPFPVQHETTSAPKNAR